jgi:hypothetical protein
MQLPGARLWPAAAARMPFPGPQRGLPGPPRDVPVPEARNGEVAKLGHLGHAGALVAQVAWTVA